MSFLAPAAFALALLIPVIVALYLLRLRRTEQVVSSTYLWRRNIAALLGNFTAPVVNRWLSLAAQLTLCRRRAAKSH